MSISVTIPLDALNDPKVAKALSDLMLSLGGVAPVKAGRARVVAEEGEVARPAAPRRRRAAPKAPFGEGLSENERYEAFIEGLPAPSRRFLELIKENGTVTLSQAVEELDIKVPKAIGGITGSLSRWARDRDVDLPFKADKSSSGERIWVWTRGADEAVGNDSKRATSGAKRNRARRKAPSQGAEASGEDSSDSSEGSAGAQPADNGLAALLEGQTDTAREFLSLLSQRGELTMAEALKSFGLKHAQAIGAVIRSFRKRAKERSLTIPFEESRSRTGERMWTWTGFPSTDTSSEERARSAPGSGVLRRKPGDETATPV